MKPKIMLFIGCLPLFLFAGCGGTAKGENLEIPTNMPPACREINFAEQPDMRELCGVRVVHFQSYKNIPQQRYLINPKDASIVHTGDLLELRFPNTLPVDISGPIVNEINFDPNARLNKIPNKYEYFEVYPKDSDRIRIFKLSIPTDVGNIYSYCFRIPERKGNSRTRSVAMGNHLEAMTCKDFDNLVSKHQKPPKHK